MTSQQASAIASQGKLCVHLFDELCRLLRDPVSQEEARISQSTSYDELGRFRIWAGNIGALQDIQSPASLSHRLREQHKIASRIMQLLEDLKETLEDG